MRVRKSIRKTLLTLKTLFSLISTGGRLVGVYMRFRLKLWWWRRRSLSSFRKHTRGLPRGLREDLEKSYASRIEEIRVPGLREVFSLRSRGIGSLRSKKDKGGVP